MPSACGFPKMAVISIPFMAVWFTHTVIAEETTGFLQQNSICQFCVCAQSCPTVSDPLDCSPPGFSVHGIFQARIIEWVAISYSRGSSRPRNRSHVSCVSCTGRWILLPPHYLGSPMSILNILYFKVGLPW